MTVLLVLLFYAPSPSVSCVCVYCGWLRGRHRRSRIHMMKEGQGEMGVAQAAQKNGKGIYTETRL